MNAPAVHFDKVRHCYTVDGLAIPSVTEILAPLNSFRYVKADVLRAARERGTAVHVSCELDDQGVLDEASVAPALAGYLAAWRLFRKTNDTHWIMVEAPVFNPQMGYAGTVDRYGFIDGEKAVLDIKSGSSLYPPTGPQLAAYAKAIPQTSACTRRIAVLLKPSGHFEIEEYRSAMDWAVFASLLTLRSFCQLHKITPDYGVRP
jgi:hypothetical protein